MASRWIKDRVGSIYRRLLTVWRRIHPPGKEFWTRPRRLILAVALAIALTIAGQFDFAPLAASARNSHDIIERVMADLPDREGAPAIVYVDIDDFTYRRWGRSFFTPRDRLVDLLSCVSSGAPESIVLDIALDTDGKELHGDELLAFLSHYGVAPPPTLEPPDDSSCTAPWSSPEAVSSLPPIIMTLGTEKRIRQLGGVVGPPAECGDMIVNEDRHASSYYSPASENQGRPEGARPRLAVAVSAICQDDDGTIREWMLWDELGLASDPDELLTLDGAPPYKPKRFPSVALLVNALHSAGSESTLERIKGDLEECLNELESDCRIGSGAFTFDARWRARTQRLLYSFGSYDGALPPTVTLNGRSVRALEVIGADLAAQRRPTEDFYRDRVVIIGSSYLESGDIHGTPLGEMPGSYVVANTILSLNEHDQINALSSGVVNALTFLVLTLSLIVIFWRTGVPTIAGVVCSLVLLAVGCWARRFGISVDFILPGFIGLMIGVGKEIGSEMSKRGAKARETGD